MNNQMNQYMWSHKEPEKPLEGCKFCHSYNCKQIDTEVLEDRTIITYQCFQCMETFEIIIKDENLMSDTWLNTCELGGINV